MYYYCVRERDRKFHIYSTCLDEVTMTWDYSLYDSPEECARDITEEFGINMEDIIYGNH